MLKAPSLKNTLAESRFDFIAGVDKDFILAFDNEINKLGYDSGGNIGSGYCWGKYMIIYSRTGVKSKKIAARIYIREDSIVLRLFFNQIDSHRSYIENAPPHIKQVFTGEHGDCHRCKNDKNGVCKFRKAYTLDGRSIEKCNGVVFEFRKPDLAKLQDYISLLSEFYPVRK